MAPPGIVLEVALHVATTLAIIVYFRRRLVGIFAGAAGGREGWLRFAALLAVATIPAAVVGVALEAHIELLFESVRAVGGALLFTAVVLLGSIFLRRGRRGLGELGFTAAFVIGVAQAAAIVPGVSRAGMTIVAGLAAGLASDEAIAFSFLLSIPAILGAGVLEIRKIDAFPGSFSGIAVACIIAFVAGLAAIHFVRAAAQGRRFGYFGVYCAAVGVVALLI